MSKEDWFETPRGTMHQTTALYNRQRTIFGHRWCHSVSGNHLSEATTYIKLPRNSRQAQSNAKFLMLTEPVSQSVSQPPNQSLIPGLQSYEKYPEHTRHHHLVNDEVERNGEDLLNPTEMSPVHKVIIPAAPMIPLFLSLMTQSSVVGGEANGRAPSQWVNWEWWLFESISDIHDEEDRAHLN